MKKVNSIIEAGTHLAPCPKCKHENFLGFWHKHTSPMNWRCVNCKTDFTAVKTEPTEKATPPTSPA